jgi:hypothetical protein
VAYGRKSNRIRVRRSKEIMRRKSRTNWKRQRKNRRDRIVKKIGEKLI